MLTLEDVTVIQNDFRLSADFSVPTGARVGILGPSGAGKSTLLAVIAGFIQPDTGRILWQGSDLTSIPPGKRPLSILFQDQNLFPHLSVADNAGLGLNPSLRLSVGDRDRVHAALSRVGLEGFGSRKPGTLSGGQQTRVALARALLQERPLMLLDEPFAALGPALKGEMLDLVAELVGETGATVLMVSHDPADARRFADQTVFIADSLAHPPQPTARLLDNPPPQLAAYLGH